MQRKVKIRAGQSEAGQPLLNMLCRRFSYLDKNAWQHHIDAGRLLVNGTAAQGGTPLSKGDGIEFRMPPMREPPVDRDFSVIYESRELLAVDKPANLPCHPAGRYFNHTLWALLKEVLGLDRPLFIHRLDRETSGIVLVAKDRAAARFFRQVFEDGRVVKRYVAVVEGQFPLEAIRADGFLLPDAGSGIRKKRRFCLRRELPSPPPGAQACCTVFTGKARHGGVSLVEAVPLTGRLHQIRASLNGLGFPLVGDKLYGTDETRFLRFISGELTSADRLQLRIGRQALHAAEIHLPLPGRGPRLSLCSPLPPDLAGLLAGSP